VVEIDAASNNGIDDVREIIDAVRYAAVSARYKVYIIDEVHMMSKPAFNAILKTLEEPPAHVKFLFATTEVQKVPVTVLSRCQRFDLRRIPADKLAAHFRAVSEAEGVQVEEGALALIARAAEGSARDGLSILDQAIAHGEAGVTADQVRSMLGLSDRGAIRSLLGLLLAGDAAGALAAVREQYDLGVEPSALLRGLLEIVHAVTRAKVGGADDPAQSVEEREAYGEWASRLSHAAIHRLWQLLLKGLSEVHAAPMPLEAAEMALLRVIHASDLPDPGALAETLERGEGAAARAPAAAASPPAEATMLRAPATFRELIDLLEAKGRRHLGQQLHDYARLIRYAPPELVISLTGPVSTRDLVAALKEATGQAWIVRTEDSGGEPTQQEQVIAAKKATEQSVLETPLVKAAMEAFPGAELAGYSLDEQRSA
jgi:DNA polymerase-3 subunit gamma/tau